jgi:hypothetical protein
VDKVSALSGPRPGGWRDSRHNGTGNTEVNTGVGMLAGDNYTGAANDDGSRLLEYGGEK